MLLLQLNHQDDRDRALRNGGVVVASYRDGWLVRVRAEPVGEVTYRLADGSMIRRYPTPTFVTY